jgi:gliding motility-associated-like protein
LCNREPGNFQLSNSVGTIQWQDSIAGATWKNTTGQTTTSTLYTPSKAVSMDYIRAVVTDVYGKCSITSAPMLVNADTCLFAPPIDLPNALTPNGDGNNDVFYINNILLYPNNHLIIYNRWGNKVYETSGYINDWEGKTLPEATYYYVLELGKDVNGESNEKNKYQGSVTIVR